MPESDGAKPAAGSGGAPTRRAGWRRVLRGLLLGLTWIALIPMSAWAAGALYYDSPFASLRGVLAIVYAVVVLGAAVLTRGGWKGVAIGAAGFAVVLAWWLTIQPSNTRDWQPDVAVLPWAEFNGDTVTVHNVRNCVYRSETDYDVKHDDRTYDLTKLKSLDLFLVHWGSPLIAHTMMSFGFDDGRYLCFSIEVRKEKGEGYSAIKGFYRQFELTYIVADERDLVRLRTNYRVGEDVRLYRLNTRPGMPRKLIEAYLKTATDLSKRPRWYNALTSNCTTNIFTLADQARGVSIPWDWRILANGKLDEALYEHGRLAGAGKGTLEQIKAATLINARVKGLPADENYSRAIREGVPGCE